MITSEYERLCVFLRDVGFERAIRAGDPRVLRAVEAGLLPNRIPIAVPMKLRVLDGLYAIGAWLSFYGMPRPIDVTSAYRHPFYNRVMVEGAAKDGEHTQGGAIDMRIEGVSIQRVGQMGSWLGVGGIGFYPSKGFVHMDGGAQRSWRGK